MLVVALIKVESGFQHKVISTKGARGLMQIRPFVATALVEEADVQSWEGESSLEDPIVNIKIGCFYLSHLEKQFGDLELALTAYNWGPARVEDRLEGQKSMPFGFARNVIAIYLIYENLAYEHKTPIPYSSLGVPST
jgi:soluble lytic murein transglycosylase